MEERQLNEVTRRDVGRFIRGQKEHRKPGTIVAYLFHIGKYLGWSGQEDLEKFVKQQSIRLKPKETARNMDHNDVKKMLMDVTDLEGRLLVRLLLFTEIPIDCLKNLRPQHIFDENKYEMPCKGRTIRGIFHSDAPEVIKEYIRRKDLGTDDELLDMSTRHIENLIPKYAWKVGTQKRVTPKDLRKVGKDEFKRKWLIEDYRREKGVLKQQAYDENGNYIPKSKRC